MHLGSEALAYWLGHGALVVENNLDLGSVVYCFQWILLAILLNPWNMFWSNTTKVCFMG